MMSVTFHTPTVVLNDTCKPHQIKSTVAPPKPNLTKRFCSQVVLLKDIISLYEQKYATFECTHQRCKRVKLKKFTMSESDAIFALSFAP